jgi:hypothetical protein
MAFNSFLVMVMLGMEDFDFSNTQLIINLNSMPSDCGSFKRMDYTAHGIPRLECRSITEKFKHFMWTASSVCENIFGKNEDTFLRI